MKKYIDQSKVDTRSGFGAWLLMFVCLICAVGCSSVNKAPDNALSDSHKIELCEALEHLDAFLDEFNAKTKADICAVKKYSLDKIETLKSQQILPQATRSNGMPDCPEDLLYMVNFDDDMGYAVLAADNRLCDNILCVTESGNISEGDFAKMNMLFSNERDTVVGSEDSSADISKPFITSLLLSSVINSIIDNKAVITHHTRAVAPTSTKYGPYVFIKWDQNTAGSTHVFDVYTPDNAPAGCVVIAVAQILLSTKVFNFTVTDGTVCRSDTMKTVARYTSPWYPGTSIAKMQAGKFVYELGHSGLLVHASYPNFFHTGTSATADDAKRALEAFQYSNVTKYLGFNDDNKGIATTQIREGRPVYLGGQPDWTVWDGHAWLLDGEWDPYYHINWGWNGAADGYFNKGLFDTTQRQLYDSQIDSLTYGYTNFPHKWYTWTYRMVTYSL